MAYDKAIDSAQLDSWLSEIADTIRAKNGTSAPLAFPAGFAAAIEDIPTGGTDGIKIMKQNLINADQNIINQYYHNGVLTAYDSWDTTQLIPIESGKVYAVSLSTSTTINSMYTPLFDAGRNFVRNFGNAGGFLTPSNGGSYVLFVSPITGYIAFSGLNTAISSMRMYRCVGSLIEVE